MRVQIGVADLIDDAVVAGGALDERRTGAARKVRIDPGVGDIRLIGHHLDLIEPRQLAQQYGAVARNAGLERGQRRNEGQSPTLAVLRNEAGSGPSPRAMRRDDRLQGSAGAFAPRELFRLLEAVLAQAPPEIAVGQRLGHLCGDGGRLARVEQRRLQTDDLRDAGVVGPDRGRAARHRLQRRQAKPFLQRWKHEDFASVVESHEIGFGDETREGYVRGAQTDAARQLRHAPPLGVGDRTDDGELSVAPCRRVEQRIGPDEAVDVLPGVKTTGVHDEGTRQIVAAGELGDRVFADRQRSKPRTDRARDVDDLAR